MKKLIFFSYLFLFLLPAGFPAFSAQVSENTAKNTAFNFLKTVDGRLSSSSLSMVYTRENAFYIFSYETGWVIVSCNDRVMNNSNNSILFVTNKQYVVYLFVDRE